MNLNDKECQKGIPMLDVKTRHLCLLLMLCVTVVSDGLSTSIVSSTDEPITTNRDSIAYCAIQFASATNKIPVAAAAKVLEAYDKMIEAKSADVAATYVLHMGGTAPLEDYLQRFASTMLLDKLQFMLEHVLVHYSYGALDAVDGVLDIEIRNEQYVSDMCYATNYVNMQNKMSDKQFLAFVAIRAYYRAKMNEIFMRALINNRFSGESSEKTNTKEAGGDAIKTEDAKGVRLPSTNNFDKVQAPKVPR